MQTNLKETRDTAAPARAPVIDISHLEHMTLGDQDLATEVLRLFDRQADMLLARMAAEPPKVVAALAHTLLGSARSVGAWQVAEAAAALELLAPQAAGDALAPALARLTQAVADARQAIAAGCRI